LTSAATSLPKSKVVENEAQRLEELQECYVAFATLFAERAKQEPKPDLISMMAHSEATRGMDRGRKDDLIKLLETAKVELADARDDELREALGILKGHVSFVYAPLRGESVIRAYLLVSHALSEKLLSGE